jgi:carboxymethylenebutenolidase
MKKEDISRRAVIAGTVTTGFALAVQPVSAQTVVQTDTKGLNAGETEFKAADGTMIPAYHAYPKKGKNFPVVFVIQEIFGVHEHIKDVCRRFAKKGYFAIAPSLYHRQGDVTKLEMKDIFPIVQKVPDAQVMTDLDDAVAFVKSLGKADVSKLGITGFCWGGRVVWLYAAHNPNLKAGAAWYGRVEGPSGPLENAAKIKTPILGLYGAKDGGIPVAGLEKMREALKTSGNNQCEIVIYPEAQHGFHADYRPSYSEKDAKDGFSKLLAWFAKNGA